MPRASLTGQEKMTTINLYQKQEEQQKFYSKAANKGLLFSLGVLVLTFALLAGLKFASFLLNKQNESLLTTIQTEKEGLAGLNNIEQVVDMQTRLKWIGDNLQIKSGKVLRPQMTQILDHVSAEINAGTILSSYKYENGSSKISLALESNNFNDAARQILNLKASDYFTNVNLVEISRGEKAISYEVEMGIK